MLKQLRLRMAFMIVLTTAVVFAVAMATMAVLSEIQYRQVNELSFLRAMDSLINQLHTARITDELLSQTEISNQCVISVTTNGVPLFFRGVWQTSSKREDLLAAASAAGEPSQTASLFQLTGPSGDQYRCIQVAIPQGKDVFSLTMLGDLSQEQRVILNRRLLYAVIFLAVLAALGLLSWWFSGKAVRPAAETLQKQREFIAAASHELRSPLTVIGAGVSALRLKPENTQLIDKMEAECHRMGRLISDMLLLANSDAKAWPLKLEEIGLDTLLIDAVDKLGIPAKATGAKMKLELPEELLPSLYGDAERLQQVLAILIDNAVEYAGGEITVRAYLKQERALIEVADQGPGIPPQDRNRIFDRFFRGDAARSEKRHCGLGLSVAQELVQLHGGTLALLETPGGGCTFRIALPYRH